jgi:hypothetical protein
MEGKNILAPLLPVTNYCLRNSKTKLEKSFFDGNHTFLRDFLKPKCWKKTGDAETTQTLKIVGNPARTMNNLRKPCAHLQCGEAPDC